MTNDDGFVEPMRFYNDVMDSETEVRERVIENDTGARIKVELHEVDRKKLLDQINKLPDEMLQTLSEADDEDEAEEMAEEQNMLSSVDGSTIAAFENICALSMDDPNGKLTPHHFEDLVTKLDFDVLFNMGAEVIEISLGDTGKIKHFHEPE